MAEFYERLSLLREEKGLNKTEMAKRLGIPVSTYSNYEYGNREPDFTLAKKIADYFHVTTDYLLGRDGKEENSADTKDLAEIMDSIMTYNGKELNQHDKDVVEGLISAYLNNKA